jgi:KDO2-lipid IV(A) lauroyltransferase
VAERGGPLQALQLALVHAALLLTRLLPMGLLRPASRVVADGAFRLVGSRRRLAADNLRQALGVGPEEALTIARASFRSFALTAVPEVVKLRRHLLRPDAATWLHRRAPEAEAVFARARALHEQSGGCVFVTLHLGNWEILPYVAAVVGIPLAVAVRPLDNVYLERLLARARAATGQRFLVRRHALMQLSHQLGRGVSAAVLADQSTINGVPVEFLGRSALTTPVPALLALRKARPIVVVACVRTGPLRFTGLLADPIWPGKVGDERSEVARLTRLMSRSMETMVAAHPDQYLWMHDRWKSYD